MRQCISQVNDPGPFWFLCRVPAVDAEGRSEKITQFFLETDVRDFNSHAEVVFTVV